MARSRGPQRHSRVHAVRGRASAVRNLASAVHCRVHQNQDRDPHSAVGAQRSADATRNCEDAFVTGVVATPRQTDAIGQTRPRFGSRRTRFRSRPARSRSPRARFLRPWSSFRNPLPGSRKAQSLARISGSGSSFRSGGPALRQRGSQRNKRVPAKHCRDSAIGKGDRSTSGRAPAFSYRAPASCGHVSEAGREPFFGRAGYAARPDHAPTLSDRGPGLSIRDRLGNSAPRSSRDRHLANWSAFPTMVFRPAAKNDPGAMDPSPLPAPRPRAHLFECRADEAPPRPQLHA